MSVIAVPATIATPDDPSELGWPVTLPLEIAMAEHPPQDICLSYNIGRDEWRRLIADDRFRAAVQEAWDELQAPGARFRVKIKAQAEGYLARMWALAHDADNEKVPARVQAQIMTFAIQAAGLDASIEQKAKAQQQGNSQTNNLQIVLQLGDD